MEQPIFLLMRKVTDTQIKKIEKIAVGYKILNSNELPKNFDLSLVEIIFGWNKILGEKILNTPNSQLKWVQVYSAGVEELPLTSFLKKGILVSNASGVHSIPITETVLGMLLSHYRGIRLAIQDQELENWNATGKIKELKGQSLLIVGTGAIGRQLAQSAHALGVNVYGINRTGYEMQYFKKNYPQTEIDDVLPKMDIVVNILPLTEKTVHFYDEQRFSKMKDKVVFINVGRGPSVDTSALLQACRTGKIGFAGIDVFESEPLPKDSSLWALKNVLVTPHISGKTDQYDARFFEIFFDNISNYIENGQLTRNQINLELGY